MATIENAQDIRDTQDSEGAARQARRVRFGSLPERIRLEDTVQALLATTPDPARDAYNDDEWLIRNVI